MKRRQLLGLGSGLLGAGLLGHFAFAGAPKAGRAGRKFEVAYSETEWKKRLSTDEYSILRESGTERAFTSELLHEGRSGTFICAGCALPVYVSKDKFDSGTGWPSFTRAVKGNVLTETDTRFFMERTEVLCRRCGGHLGHVFDDGPAPTGKRHCINGDALDFVPAKA